MANFYNRTGFANGNPNQENSLILDYSTSLMPFIPSPYYKDVKKREVLMHARAASEASAEMLNTLLDFSRIDAGVVEPKLGRYPLQALFNKLENELAPQANAKDLVYRSRETGAVVHSDPVLVELILRNLVTNAIRYTDSGGVLVVCWPRKN
ncbi:MAG: hypothetical protein CTY16_19540 [Methylobacter sp.]|nr:MAG: hypothetical protein CTY16_19540 [Methylobacter sp.]